VAQPEGDGLGSRELPALENGSRDG
jgi:hypothetical protein